jgi:hypothetical protein
MDVWTEFGCRGAAKGHIDGSNGCFVRAGKTKTEFTVGTAGLVGAVSGVAVDRQLHEIVPNQFPRTERHF